MLLIGNVMLNCKLILAPMAGISDIPFRLINRSFGCGFAFTEMISAKSLIHKNKGTLKMLSADRDNGPLGVQIFGQDPDTIKRALEILSDYSFDILDFNAACPVSKVVSSGEGAWLLKEPAKLQGLLKVIVKNTHLPVTVKIRSGWDETSVNAIDIALRAQDAGVSGLIIHGRTREQGYSGRVDYKIIRDVKEAVQIPVIASGDALSPELISRLFDETGCDGVVIARGALGNPWIFRDTNEFMKTGFVPLRPDVYEITQIMKDHLELNIQYHGEISGVMRFRKFFGWYTRGMAVKRLKTGAFSAVTRTDMIELIDELKAFPSESLAGVS